MVYREGGYVVQLSGIYGIKPPSLRATARGRGLFTLPDSCTVLYIPRGCGTTHMIHLHSNVPDWSTT